MNPTTTLHLGDIDMIVFLGLIDKKIETIKKELFKLGLSTSEKSKALADLKEQLLKSPNNITSYNTFK